MTGSGFKIVLLGLVLGLFLGAEALAAVPAGKADALKARAASSGKVRVIAEIEAPRKLVGKLDPASRAAYMRSIGSLQAALAQQVAARRASPSSLREITRFRFVPFMVYEVDSAGVDVLAGLPQVTSLSEDVPEAPFLASSLPVIGAAAAWAAGYDGTGQAVVVLDTGVDTNHPFFPPSKIVAEACFSSNSGTTESFCPGQAASSTAAGSGRNCHATIDGCSHGTHVAGIAVGNDGVGPNTGVARGAGLIPIQVFTCFGNLSKCDGAGSGAGSASIGAYPSDQTQALEHVLDLSESFDIAAVNISIGSQKNFYSTQSACDSAGANLLRKAAIDQLRSAGIATVIAAGNSSRRGELSEPGCISSAISVGATTDGDEIASFSNVASFLDLLAPGVDIVSSVPPSGGVLSQDGTSMAAPHVAGAWAVLRQVDPAATVDQLLTALRSTAEQVDDQRIGGLITNMRRINLDLAIAQLPIPVSVYESNPLAGSTLDFGPVNLGASSAVLDVEVSNTGDADLTLLCQLLGDDAGSFTLVACPGAIVPASSDDVIVRCDPADGGNLTSVLQLSSNAPGTPKAIYNLACSGLGPEVEFSPLAGEEFDFGKVQNGTASEQLSVQLSNPGNQALTLACLVSGTDDTQFAISACPATVSAAGMETVLFRCEPSATGSFAATLEISTNDQNEPLATFPLVCEGVEPELDADPETGASLDFADVDVGTQSLGQYITLENNGAGELLVTCELTGAAMEQFAVVNCPESIAASNSQLLEVRCMPENLGGLSAQLTLGSNDADEPSLSYDLLCNGVSPEFDPDLPAGTLLDFGAVYTGQLSEIEQLLIDNPGTSILLLACELQGTDTDSFEILQCPEAIAVGQAGSVQVRCNSPTDGNKSAQLVLSSNDPDESIASYDLACDVAPELVFDDSFEDLPPEP